MTTNKKLITYEELSKHINRGDCWVAIDNKVLNVSKFLAEHPGGEDILMANSGKDSTKQFESILGGKGHTDYARSFFEMYYIGDLDTNSPKVEPVREFKMPLRKITYEELAKHDKEEDCWIIVDKKVYDMTAFLNDHPGGPQTILDKAGDDATQAFRDQGHSDNAMKIAQKYEVGIIDETSPKVHNGGASSKGIQFKDIAMIIVGLMILGGIAIYFNMN